MPPVTRPALRMHVLGPREAPGSQAHPVITQAFSQFPVAGRPLPGLLSLWLAVADGAPVPTGEGLLVPATPPCTPSPRLHRRPLLVQVLQP